jgi:hypothetical protein
MNDYEILKAAGHSAFKAAEIVLDAKRGDKHAQTWIAAAVKALRDRQLVGTL